MTTIDTSCRVLRHHDPGSNRRHIKRTKAHRYTRDGAIAFVIACLLTGCMFGDNSVPYAHGGLAAYTTDCVPKECFYGCCQGPKSQELPQRIGDDNPWKARCNKLATTHTAYREYLDLLNLDINYCDNEGGFEWGPCTPIEAKYVQKVAPNGEGVSAGLDFNECPPSGDWIAHPIGEDEIVIVPKPQP